MASLNQTLLWVSYFNAVAMCASCWGLTSTHLRGVETAFHTRISTCIRQGRKGLACPETFGRRFVARCAPRFARNKIQVVVKPTSRSRVTCHLGWECQAQGQVVRKLVKSPHGL